MRLHIRLIFLRLNRNILHRVSTSSVPKRKNQTKHKNTTENFAVSDGIFLINYYCLQ